MPASPPIEREEFDSFRYLDGATKRLVKTWIKHEPSQEIPWTPMGKPLSDATVALVSSAGIALRSDAPFDEEGERRNPWWGDPTCRFLPRDTRTAEARACHLHINTSYAEQDLNCVLPLDRLAELEESGFVGRSAPTHYSFMGFILDPTVLLEETTPKIIAQMKEEGVDAALLVPV